MIRNHARLLVAASAAAILLYGTPALAQGTGVRVEGTGEATTGIGDVEPGGRDDPDERRGKHGEASHGPDLGLDHERAQREANEERDAVHFGEDPDTDPEGGIDGPGGGAGPRF